MTISRDLFLAILSMDSYNRGYGAGIAKLGATDGLGTDIGTQIGTAKIQAVSRSDEASPEFAAGFYAVACRLDDGTTVISRRGTDDAGLEADPVQGGSDIVNGRMAGAGQPTSRTGLALDVHEAAPGAGVPAGPQAGVALAGLSLGGLAG